MDIWLEFVRFVHDEMFFGLLMKFKRVSVERESESNEEEEEDRRMFSRRLLACDHENVRPDILILGKALSGGFYPVEHSLLRRTKICFYLTKGFGNFSQCSSDGCFQTRYSWLNIRWKSTWCTHRHHSITSTMNRR